MNEDLRLDFDFEKVSGSWDLKDYYDSVLDERIDEDVERIAGLVERFISDFKGKIAGLDEDGLIEFFRRENEFGSLVAKIEIFMLYVSSLDTQSQEILKREDELTHRFTMIFNELTFVSQEFKERGEEDLLRLSKSSKLLPWRNYLFQKALSVKYVLSEEVEKVLNLKGPSSGGSAFGSLYEELQGSFVFRVKLPGEKKFKDVTESEVRALRMSPDEDVRREAFRSIREVYNDKRNQIVFGNCYSNILKDCTSDVRVRGFDGVMSSRNLREELEDEVVDVLLVEVEKSYPLFQRFLRLKAKVLKKEKLDVWDVQAPLFKEEKKFEFEEGLRLFLEVAKDFDLEFFEFAKDMFEKKRVDVFPKKGKRGGAFACYDKGFDSYVLLNWTDKLGDVSTLAHEFGHAFHGYLAQRQEHEVYRTGMCLAETASVFSEMVLSESLKERMSKDERLAFLDEKLGDVFATIHRQVQYVLFERRCHERILKGEGLSFEDFNLMWREGQVKMSGEFLNYDVEKEVESTWSMIPHIFRTPFYCYAYSFGQVLTFALFSKFKEVGPDFVPRYKEFLAAGGSLPPADLVKETIGEDVSKPEFFQGAFKVISEMLDEFESLI